MLYLYAEVCLNGKCNIFDIRNMHSNFHKTLKDMSIDETDRIIKLIKEAIKQNRSKREIIETFKDAGIITKNGNLKSPYKEIYIPSEK